MGIDSWPSWVSVLLLSLASHGLADKSRGLSCSEPSILYGIAAGTSFFPSVFMQDVLDLHVIFKMLFSFIVKHVQGLGSRLPSSIFLKDSLLSSFSPSWVLSPVYCWES